MPTRDRNHDRSRILKVLETLESLCLDNEEERQVVAATLMGELFPYPRQLTLADLYPGEPLKQ